MGIANVINLIGGLALFLFGMNSMSAALTKMSGGKLEDTLRKLTSNPLKSILLGTGITIAIQSSSAMTVMLVGLVNSGVMKLEQTVAVIMGSNIGKTLTSWLLSLSGIQSDNIFIQMLKPESFAPILAIIGVAMTMVCKNEKKRDTGSVMLGFAVLMIGMTTMSGSVAPLANEPWFATALTYFKNPLLGLFTGIFFTAIIQSSAASVGILQALCLTVNISYRVAIPIVLGQNIGTCITAVLASIGVNKEAKRVAAVHVLFNAIGAAVFLVFLYGGNALFNFTFLDSATTPVGIAVAHSIFNILNTLVLLPFRKQLQNLAQRIIPDAKGKEKNELLDERLILTPPLAVEHTTMVTANMAKQSCNMLLESMELVRAYDKEKAAKLWKTENDIDIYEDKLGTYLIKIGSKAITERDSRQVSMLLEDIVDFERISDHGANIIEIAREMSEKNISFSSYAKDELNTIVGAVRECLDLVCDSFENKDITKAKRVEPLEQVVDNLRSDLRDRHTKRLRDGICTMETGILFLDILTNLERVSDHCSNVAVNLIRILDEGSFDTHEYLEKLKSSHEADYDSLYAAYSDKYKLTWIKPENYPEAKIKTEKV